MAVMLLHLDRDTGIELLRLLEVIDHAIGHIAAGQLDNALIPLGMGTLVDGKGQIATAKDGGEARLMGRPVDTGEIAEIFLHRRQLFLIEFGITTDRPAAGHIDDHHGDRPVTAGLEREDAVIF